MFAPQKPKIDFLAREPHHALHARAVYDALPERRRGIFTSNPAELSSGIVAVFSYGDLKQVSQLGKKAVFGEHGVGMYYNTEHPSYAGSGEDRDCVVLRLSPNENHAAKERATLDCPVEVVGVPKMDKWANARPKMPMRARRATIAISFHWDCLVCPETRSSFLHYKSALLALRSKYRVIGHGHPRIIERMRSIYKAYGIVIEEDFEEVMRKADVYICDNSSTIFEFAFQGKPVVLLNCPSYRKDVEHPGNPRFWKHAGIGPQVDRPEDLVGTVDRLLQSYREYLPKMAEATREIFTFTDGRCAERAAAAITKHL
ncbi:MAG: CDP-glycerol glycerophosphotransferase family protein [Candidatus Paceibacterota bacterium]|jgi:glycosyltransferase involved in cell wall biosynthesis